MFLGLNPWLRNGRVFNKFKPLNIWIKSVVFIERFTPAKVLIYQSTHASDLGGFLTHVQKFSRLLKKFEVCVSWEAVCNIFDRFFCLIFWNGFQPLARFTEYWIYNYWNWFVLWWQTLGAKICRFLTLVWHDHFEMAIFGRYLIGEVDVWKHFKYWLLSSNVLLKHWTYLPQDVLVNSKTMYLLKISFTI